MVLSSKASATQKSPETQSQNPYSEWILLLVLASVQFAHIVDFVIIMPLGPQFMRVLSIAPQEFGLLVSAYTFSAAVFGFIGAFFIDRFDRKAALLTLLTGFTIGTLLCALSHSYEQLLVARVFAGGFGGIMNAVVFAIIGDAFVEERRGAATGTVMSAFSIASIAGVPAGLYLANHFGWQSTFFVLTGFSLGVLIFALKALPSFRDHLIDGKRQDALDSLKTIFLNRNHAIAFGFIIMLMFAAFSVIPYISPYLVANVGLLETDLPYVYLVGGGITFLTARFIGKLADRYGKPRLFMILAVLSMLPVLVLTHLPQVSVPMAILVTSVFTVMTSGRSIPAMSMITSSVVTRHRGSFMSFTSSIQQLASGTASLIAGLIISETAGGQLIRYDYIGYLSVTATFIAIILGSQLRIARD